MRLTSKKYEIIPNRSDKEDEDQKKEREELYQQFKDLAHRLALSYGIAPGRKESDLGKSLSSLIQVFHSKFCSILTGRYSLCIQRSSKSLSILG